MKILILNGPNLNLVGTREQTIYGNISMNDYMDNLMNRYRYKEIYFGLELDYFQSNHEGDLIDEIQKSEGVYDGIILNAGAYTHTSIAIHDAILAVTTPVIEVHISNIAKREEFRKTSYISAAAVGTIMGLGLYGYEAALLFLLNHYEK